MRSACLRRGSIRIVRMHSPRTAPHRAGLANSRAGLRWCKPQQAAVRPAPAAAEPSRSARAAPLSGLPSARRIRGACACGTCAASVQSNGDSNELGITLHRAPLCIFRAGRRPTSRCAHDRPTLPIALSLDPVYTVHTHTHTHRRDNQIVNSIERRSPVPLKVRRQRQHHTHLAALPEDGCM